MRWHALLSAAALALAHSAQDTPGPGYGLTPLPHPGALIAARTSLASGEVLVFDGLSIDLYTAQGDPQAQIGFLPEFVFPSFVVVDPGEEFMVLGESSTGALYTLSLGSAGAPDLLTSLHLNYDAAFRDSSEVFVSAATCGFLCGNEIWRVDVLTGATRLVARVSGASGPIAFDAQGNLYYGTATALFPPPPKPSAVLRWSAAQLAGSLVLDESDAQLIGGGFVGATQLCIDPRDGAIFLAESNFSSGENRIRRVLGAADESPLLMEGRPFLTPGNLDFHPGTGAATFLPHQPTGGGVLRYTTTDFGSLSERYELTPRRPRLDFSGPGTAGPGPFQMELDSGPPGGYARVLFCARDLVPLSERVFRFDGVPLFIGLHLPSLGSLPGLQALDSSGALNAGYHNPGGLEGLFGVQLLLFDGELHLAGSSARSFL